MEELDSNKLELEKLKLEINKLRLPWYKNLIFWKTAIPTLAILASLYFTFGRGIVDAQKEKLGIQKEQLKLEILQFEKQKKNVQKDISEAELELESKEFELYKMNSTLDSLSDRIEFYKKEIYSYKNQIERLAKDRKLDREFYTNELLNQYKLENRRAKEKRKHLSKISSLERQILGLKAENKFYSERVQLSKSDSNRLNMAKLNAESSYSNTESKKLKENMKNLVARFKSEKERINKLNDEQLARELDLMFIKIQAEENEEAEKNE